jgi:hypothetical protein
MVPHVPSNQFTVATNWILTMLDSKFSRWRQRWVPFPRIRRNAVRWKSEDVSEHTATIFRIEEQTKHETNMKQGTALHPRKQNPATANQNVPVLPPCTTVHFNNGKEWVGGLTTPFAFHELKISCSRFPLVFGSFVCPRSAYPSLHFPPQPSSTLLLARHEHDFAARNLITFWVLKGQAREQKGLPRQANALRLADEAYIRQHSIQD